MRNAKKTSYFIAAPTSNIKDFPFTLTLKLMGEGDEVVSEISAGGGMSSGRCRAAIIAFGEWLGVADRGVNDNEVLMLFMESYLESKRKKKFDK